MLVTAHCPHGEVYGGQLRTLNIARVLNQCGTLEIVLFPFGPLSEEALNASRDEFSIRKVFYFSQPSSSSLFARLKREFHPYAADTEAKRLSKVDENEMFQIASEYDLIWFQGIAIPNCLGRARWPNSILDIDDVPSQCFMGKAKEARNHKDRLMAIRKVAQWKRREKVFLNRFSVMAVCSEQDRDLFGGSDRVCVIPNGFDAPASEPVRKPPSFPCIGFIGTFQYTPNVEGIRWFVDKVWPLILEQRPDVRLRLVGTGTEHGVGGHQSNIDGLGFVTDSESEIATWTLMIVPILVGGGTRIKIAEAFSRGCPVVSTNQGAYGYQIQNGRECVLADEACDFAKGCLILIEDPIACDAMIQRARTMFDRELDWKAIAPKITRTIEVALNQKNLV